MLAFSEKTLFLLEVFGASLLTNFSSGHYLLSALSNFMRIKNQNSNRVGWKNGQALAEIGFSHEIRARRLLNH